MWNQKDKVALPTTTKKQRKSKKIETHSRDRYFEIVLGPWSFWSYSFRTFEDSEIFKKIWKKIYYIDNSSDLNVDVLTDNLVSANMLLLFGSGIETSAITLCCCLYELALNSHVQDKARAEVREVTRNTKLSYEVAHNDLKYLDMVLSGK